MYLVNKIFNNKPIRTIWDEEKEDYYFSVVDVIDALVESKDPGDYWTTLKRRMIKEEKSEIPTNCRVLKLKSKKDGKYYSTDTLNMEGIFRLIESVPSPKAEPFKLWLASLGKERIDEIIDPSLGIQRNIDYYRTKGYDEDWISKRVDGIQVRKELTDLWNEGGVHSNKEYAILTNEIYKEWTGMTSKELKAYKGLKKESLRDNMSRIEVILSDLGEEATKELAKELKPFGLEENKVIAKMGGNTAKVAKDDLESKLNKTVITSKENKKIE
ncbi:MAG: phage antirepressor protein [Bacilli bacterium]|nr:phage antirepressor protein [Bacilli bacterium]